MQKQVKQKAASYLSGNRCRRRWKKVVCVLACMVLFCTTHVLILPAVTLEKTPNCGKEEHVHSEECYAREMEDSKTIPVCTPERLGIHKHTEDCLDENGDYCCGYADFVVHEHDATCLDAEGKLWCPLPEVKAHTHSGDCYTLQETEPAHTHTDECYAAERGELFCTIPEVEGAHTHSEEAGCYEESRELICMIPEGEGSHTHSEEAGCYDENGELICLLEETAGHQHTDDCYVQSKILTCQLEETAGHQHTDDCYIWILVLTCPWSTEPEDAAEQILICDKPEIILHEHDSDCFDENGNRICGKQQVLEHVHNQDCFQIKEDAEDAGDTDILICGLEEHTHTLACRSNPAADVETAADWERTFADVKLTGVSAEDVLAIAETQIGYTESDANFVVAPDGVTQKGYTRYGEWYGDPYADWCAMFVSFCLNYAGIGSDIVPYDGSCTSFVENLIASGLYADKSYIPVSGDLVFFDRDGDRLADHMGFVREVLNDEADDTVSVQLVTIEGVSVQLVTIEGDSDNCVQSAIYPLTDETILGYGMLPAKEVKMKAKLAAMPVMPVSLFSGKEFGEPSLTPGHQKTIDALRDGADNPDTTLDNSSADLTDLYRLYLDVTPDERPTDLILILDNSSSMFWNWNNNNTSLGTRNEILNTELKKFIPAFLKSHDGNRIYFSYYSGKQLNYGGGSSNFPVDQGGSNAAEDAWRKYYWGTAAKTNDILNYLMTRSWKLTDTGKNASQETGRNYAAGFAQAEEALKTADPNHDVKLVFLSAGVPSYYIKNDGTRGGNGLAVEEQANSAWKERAEANEERCKTATLQTIQNFKSRYPNLVMSAIGFGGSITSGGIAEEVLKKIPQNGGSYYHENWSNNLANSLNTVLKVKLSSATISDTLSGYVDVYSPQPDYKVVMKQGGEETVLYENGVITEPGKGILQSVGCDERTRTVSAVFQPDYVLKSGVTYTLSYNVQTTQQAYKDFEKSGYTHMGESDTDYGENRTSAYRMGFHSNAGACVSYSVGDEKQHAEDYAHPVIQVKRSQGSSSAGEEISLPHSKKIDAFRDGVDSPDTDLDTKAADNTDLYRLYLDVLPLELDKPTDLLLVLDNSGSMFKTNDIGGKSRNAAMNEVLEQFIPEFLEKDTQNRISIVYFSGPEDHYREQKDLVTHNTAGKVENDAWVAYEWGNDSEAAIRVLMKECKNSLERNGAGTNYVAGFRKAADVLKGADSTHNVKMVFLSDGIPTHYIQDDGQRGGNGMSLEGQTGDFWKRAGVINEERCKQPTLNAIAEFKRSYPDLNMSAIAYSSSAGGTSSYALQAIPQNGGTLSYVTASQELRKALLGQREIKGLVLSDKLSPYVDLYTEQPDYKVVMRKDDGEDIVLYEGGKVTSDGDEILENVTYDEQNKTVSAQFKETYTLDIHYKYELSFNVKTTQAAYAEFAASGYTRKGDKNTDYGENTTSSGQPGFRSNDSAKVECMFNGTSHTEEYDHPVVQAVTCKMVIKKTDSANGDSLPGAVFALYRRAVNSETGVELEGVEGTFVKVKEGLTTNTDGQVLIENLVPGDYWLVETKAPEHYEKRDAPVPITLTHGTDGKSQIQGSSENITVGTETLPLLKIPNTRWGYELPQTGGSGSTLYTVGGLLLVMAAAVLLSYKKSRKEDFASS